MKMGPVSAQGLDVPLIHRSTFESGVALKEAVTQHLEAWSASDASELRDGQLPEPWTSAVNELRDRVHAWFGVLTVNVSPFTAYDRSHVALLLRQVSAAVAGKRFYPEYRPPAVAANSMFARMISTSPQFNIEMDVTISSARAEAAAAMDEALRLVRTAQTPSGKPISTPSSVVMPNTAFIIMWMDPARPELVDVLETAKEAFASFGIRALRADEIQHQDRITDVILQHIAQSEFLFADLSGERPNVYYEIGYAHALGKRPILYRRSGTPLHFDLSVHNVPVYDNITTLRKQLRDRLQAITGRTTE
jgi:hypothetical protein